jgi:ketosteroid isomerase-like protein
MSQENVDLVTARLRRFQARLRAGDDAETGLAPEFVWDLSTFEGWPDALEYSGRQGFNEFFAAWIEAYDEFESGFEDVIDAGDEHVVSVISQRGRLRGSQSWIDFRFGIVFTVTERNITRARVFRTAEEALEAVGLRE